MPNTFTALPDAQLTCSVSTEKQDSAAVVPPLFNILASCPGNEIIKKRIVGIVYDAVMELHLREGHLEHPDRVKELNKQIRADGLLERCHRLTPKLATNDELLMCHSSEHIARVDNLYKNPVKNDGKPAEKEGDTYIINDDIFCNKHTSKAARSAAGCAIQAVRAVLSGGVSTAFAVVRPPGHHAESNELMGFCFFNNVAVAAHAALKQPGMERVLILDWDIHHGNGTQQIFEQDKRVLFVSLHRRDGNFYPQGCGFASEVGKGEGTGYTVNVPWVSKGMADADYLAAYDLILDPIITQFDPQLVLVSAGFDATDGDFLGKCHVTPAGFAALTQRLTKHAGGKLVAVLEGGYEPELVGNCASAVLKVLLGDSPPALCTQKSFKLHKTSQKVLTTVDAVQRQHWCQLAALPALAKRYAEYSVSLKIQWLSLNRIPSPQPLSAAAAPPPVAAAPPAAVARVTRSVTAAGGPYPTEARLNAAPGLQAAAAAATAATAASDLVELLGGLSIQEVKTAKTTAAVAAVGSMLSPAGPPAAAGAQPADIHASTNREVIVLNATAPRTMDSQLAVQPATAEAAAQSAECTAGHRDLSRLLSEPPAGAPAATAVVVEIAQLAAVQEACDAVATVCAVPVPKAVVLTTTSEQPDSPAYHTRSRAPVG